MNFLHASFQPRFWSSEVFIYTYTYTYPYEVPEVQLQLETHHRQSQSLPALQSATGLRQIQATRNPMNREPIFNKHGQLCGYKGAMWSNDQED